MTTQQQHNTKALWFAVKDAAQGRVEAVFATFGVKDYDNDITLPGAFEDGAPVVISAYGHASWMGALPVGKGVIRVEEKRAILEGEFFLDTQHGADTFKTVKNLGDMGEWSYGFDVLETGEVTEELRQNGVWRVLKKLHVFEVSPVLRGAGIDTETLSAKQKKDAPEPPKAEPTAEAKAAAELATKARQEFARFMKTRAKLAVG